MATIPKGGGFPPFGAHGPPFQAAPAPVATALGGWMANATPAPHPAVSAGPIGLSAAANPAALLKCPRTPPNAPLGDYQSADSDHILKRARTIGQSGDEVSYPGPNLPQGLYSQDDLPKIVAQTLNQGSPLESMVFHHLQQTILLVGTRG